MPFAQIKQTQLNKPEPLIAVISVAEGFNKSNRVPSRGRQLGLQPPPYSSRGATDRVRSANRQGGGSPWIIQINHRIM